MADIAKLSVGREDRPRGVTAQWFGFGVPLRQWLGRLGNSGNTTAPHLHVGLIDRADAVVANALPFEIDHLVIGPVLVGWARGPGSASSEAGSAAASVS